MFTASLQDISEYNRTIGGGKALNLGKMISVGLPVPLGFVVLTTAYENFVTANHLQAKLEQLVQTVSPDRTVAAKTIGRRISELFEQRSIPSNIEAEVFNAYQQLATHAVAVRSSATATGEYLQGLPASAGLIRGSARLVENIIEAAQLVPGEILVTQGTDPGWTAVFPLVSGLVLETGGLLSHGAIIAREYGIPAVINVPGALSTIINGQTIEVDGTTGRVYLF